MAAVIALDDRLCMQTVASDLMIRPLARTNRERLAEAAPSDVVSRPQLGRLTGA
jgi:hypothetical protein